MALPSRLRRFDIELSDVDRHVYQSLSWRVAQHPSEDGDRVVVRVLARCLLYEDALTFGAGLSTVEEPALWVRDPSGQVLLWVDVGAPSAERLHRASKAADRVVVISHKPVEILRRAWSGKRIHNAQGIDVISIDAATVRSLADELGRQAQWVISRTEGWVHISDGGTSVGFDWVCRSLNDLCER